MLLPLQQPLLPHPAAVPATKAYPDPAQQQQQQQQNFQNFQHWLNQCSRVVRGITDGVVRS
jgi:hypothetical protein